MGSTNASRSASALRALIRRCRQDILAEWRRSARLLPAARTLGSVALVDHVPELIDEIADIADAVLAASGAARVPFAAARRHALDRIADGFDVSAVVEEMSMLRDAILSVWEREHATAAIADLRALDLAIDQAIHATVSRFAETHVRTLAGMDRISTASVEATNRDELLGRLLAVFKETTPAVDTAAILLVEGDRIRNCATVGLQELIGVAHMGSLNAYEFTAEDRQMFQSLAARATVAIVNHMLREELAQLASEAERALAKLESLLAASPVGIAFLDRELRYLRINDALAALNGHPAAEHIGKTVAEMLPRDAARLTPVLTHIMETGTPRLNVDVETTHPATGEMVALLANYFPVRTASGVISGVGAIIVDVTEAKRVQQALRTEQATLPSIIDHAPAAIWVKDLEGRIVIANRRLAEALMTPYETIVGKRSRDVLPADLARDHEEHDARVVAENSAIEVEEVAPSPDGFQTFLSIKFPIPGDRPLVGGIATDITDRKRIEEELKSAVQMREDLLSVVSHDLRSPLSTVQLSATVLLGQHAGDPRARRHVDMILRACSRMETLINDLLDMALIRAGRFKLELHRELLDDVVTEALELQKPIADEKGIAITSDCDLRDVEILCDRNRILQVFGNLLGNAVKFCRAGDRIDVIGHRDGDHVRFSVADTGPGIAPDALPRLFEPYWSGAEHRKGSGLGLYIVRGIVESHGGQVSVESEPGAGARFTFTLPIARPR